MDEALASKRRKIGSRACDACKIRKVRCTEAPPCERCAAAGIACTFNKAQATRGPRSLRPKTLREIRVVQEEPAQPPSRVGDEVTETQRSETPVATPQSASATVVETADLARGGTPRPTPRIAIAALVLRLCIYRLRLFPVWPIVAVEEVIASLQRDTEDLETYALANAIGAATMAQLKLDRSRDPEINDNVTEQMMEAECRRIQGLLDASHGGESFDSPNLNTLRTSFFLHVHHENQRPGGTKSLLYLREAITLSQIMGLHKSSSYVGLPAAEQQMRRRIFALLFVTERGVAMLHELPVVLPPSSKLPTLDGIGGDDEAHILPAFKKLVKLFWMFDQSGAFDMIHDLDEDDDSEATAVAQKMSSLERLQQRLQDEPFDTEPNINDVQKADICVTRQWMQILLWRAGFRRKQRGYFAHDADTDVVDFRPIHIAKEFLDISSRLPNAALEAHGPTIEFKIYEIASAVTEAIASQLSLPMNPQTVVDLRPNEILIRLQKMLAVCRGGNKSLLASLCARIAQIEERPSPELMALQQLPGADDGGFGIPDGQVPEGWLLRRAFLTGVPGADRNWSLAGLSPPSARLSPGAAPDQEQRASDVVLWTEKRSIADDRAIQQAAFTTSQMNIGNGLGMDLSWQPFALLGQLGTLDDDGSFVSIV
ncbi:hypothetical protein GQ53DRAFT_742065 [Thozetella sp. PMI_491]|nr:hypothetical protein GQ53DRAFT_742065 [Thozetella sp. PMI_491]